MNRPVAKARPRPVSRIPWWLRGRLGRFVVGSAVVVLAALGLLAGIIGLGRWSLAQVHDDPRYLVPVADIDCPAPEGMERPEFLGEVQYLARLPEKLNVLDEDLPRRLRQAFARHPWVEKVDAVTVTPPRHIGVKLTFRTPVLAVRWDDELRAVDGDGVLLPKRAPTRGLPVYDGTPRPPRGPPGTHWGDSDLERAARQRRAEKK